MVQGNTELTDFNEDELHAPDWLNKEFLELVLGEHEAQQQVDVQDYDISPGSGKGDHYASIMFRAKVNYRVRSGEDEALKNISLIIKTAPEQEGMKKDLLQEFTLFETEILMYSHLLPQMEALLRSVGDHTELCAKKIYSSLEPRQCIIFEDLVVKGYKVISNRACTMEEVKTALSKLARIHATSLKMVHEGNTEIPKLVSQFNAKTFEKFEFMQCGLKLFKEVISVDKELKKYIPYVEKVEGTITEDIIAFFNPEEIRKRGGIVMLNHGDFHMKNMMINYTENVLKDLMLVDYQISYYGPAVLDLLYSTVMLFSPEMRLHHRKELFGHYFESFQETLHRLNFTGHIPTTEEFEAELWRYRRWEMYLVMVFLIFNYVFIEGGIELGDICEKYDVRLNYWQKEKVFKELRVILPRMVEQGYFD